MYIAFGNRVLDSNDIKNIIEENTEFKVIKDMSKGSKREDIVAFNLSLDIDTLNKEISETINISEEDEDTLFEEYMATTEELGFELEEYLPEDSIMDFKAYKWEPSDNDIKAVLKIDEEQDYFTYAGESCTIDNARLSVAKGREADVGFAEVDIDNDGIKELAVEYIVTTGTASIQKMTDIYKKDSQEKMTTFVVDNHKISFTHEQEAVIIQTMKEWEAQGFMKENNITEFPFAESSISLFDSAVVEYEGEYFIKVTFATNEMSKENMNLKTIKVLLKCQNNQFDVVDMWY